MIDPFQHHASAVEQQLDVTRMRIEDARRAADASAWLTVCSIRESAVDEVEGSAVPSAWPRARFGLSATENRVLWVLIAHELCARARAAIRELETEQQPDARSMPSAASSMDRPPTRARGESCRRLGRSEVDA